MARVLIPDYVGNQVVAGARSLARGGDKVTLGTWVRGPQTGKFKSRYMHSIEALPPPRDGRRNFGDAVSALAEKVNADAVIPFGLQSCWSLSEWKTGSNDDLPVMIADINTFKRLNNKNTSTSWVRELGLDAPRIFSVSTEGDVRHLESEVRFPVVVKIPEGSGVASGLRYANEKEEMIRCWNELRERSGDDAPAPIVQEFVPGFIHDACALAVHGKPVQVVTQIRKLMYPIYGGVGAVNITTRDDELAKAGRRILEGTGWHGPTQIEFKRDARDGCLKFIEFNTKLWGTLDLSIQAGINFPGMIRNYLTGKSLQENREYRVGLRYNFWLPQAVSAYAQLYKEYGISAFKRLAKVEATANDIDLTDPLSTAYSFAITMRRILGGRLVDVNSNLPRHLINGPKTW